MGITTNKNRRQLMKHLDIALTLEKQVKQLETASRRSRSDDLPRILASVNMLVNMYYKKYISKKGKGGA